MASEVLSELELKVLQIRKGKSVEAIANEIGKSVEETRNIIQSAEHKLANASTIDTPIQSGVPPPKFFGLDKRVGEPQVGTMKVGAQIVEILGRGVYSAPWNALKELISNSYDACASRVDIQYDSFGETLTLVDDGLGMDYVDFDEHFTFISQSHKRKYGPICEICHRPLIGKFGIGFIAVSQLCDRIKVTSSKKNSDTYFVAEIDFAKLREKSNRPKQFYQLSQFTLTNFEKANLNEHYTKIEMLGLNKAFLAVLNNISPGKSSNLLFKPASFEEVIRRLCSGDVKNIRMEAGPFWEFIINLANVVPVEYSQDGPVLIGENVFIDDALIEEFHSATNMINQIKREVAELNFTVSFNGLRLKKPARFPNEDWLKNYEEQLRVFVTKENLTVTDPSTLQESKISYKGYIYYQKTRIVPEELRGMVVRVKNVAIGDPSRDLWAYPYPGDKIYMDQIYGEIFVDYGLEDSMNIDRSSFKTTHFEYVAMKEALHRFLHEVVFTTAKDMWRSRKTSKETKIQVEKNQTRSGAISAILGKDFIIEEVQGYNKAPVNIYPSEKRVVLHIGSPVFRQFSKSERDVLEDVAIALEIAMKQENDLDKIKDTFWRILKRLKT